MNESAPLQTQPVDMPPKKRKWAIAALLMMLLLLALGGIGFSIYALQQKSSLENDLSSKQKEIVSLKKENFNLQSLSENDEGEAGNPVVSDLELAQQAAQDYVDAQVLDTEYIAKTPQIDGNFASVGVAPRAFPNHIPAGIILKKSNDRWIVIHHGQNGPSQDTINRFAIPDELSNP